MVSIRQYIHDYGEKHLWGLKKPEEVSKIEKSVLKQITGRRAHYTGKVKPETLRKAALSEPLFYKAMVKKNHDTIRSWFTIKHKDEKKKVPQEVLDEIYKFDKRTKFPSKLVTGGMCSDIYGNGFIERTFVGEEAIKNDSPVKKGREPLGLISLNSEFIKTIERNPAKKDDDTLYYVYQESASQKIYIHPDRILDVATNKLPHSKFGISKVRVLYDILRSKISANTAVGEILSWHSVGILDMTIQHMNDEQQKKAEEIYKQHPTHYVHSEDYALQVLNPTQIDPEPFYDYLYTNIAAAFVMPTHILIGQQIGNVTGSEVGISEYYNDIKDTQEIAFTPLIEKVYKQLLESKGMVWDYVIHWNQVFVDELSEAKIGQARTFISVQNKNAGVIDISEARQVLNEGVIDLDINKVPKKDEPVEPTLPPTNPNVEPQPPVKKPSTKSAWVKLKKEQIQMIKDKGKKEVIEQERRIKEAEKKKEKVKKKNR